jgi:hypothetical protein
MRLKSSLFFVADQFVHYPFREYIIVIEFFFHNSLNFSKSYCISKNVFCQKKWIACQYQNAGTTTQPRFLRQEKEGQAVFYLPFF